MGPSFTLETALGMRDLGGGTKEWNEPSWSLSRSQGTNEEGAGVLAPSSKLLTQCGGAAI